MALTIQQAIEKIKGRDTQYSSQPFILQWQNVFWRTSIHTRGACPSFYPLRYEGNNTVVLNQTLYTPVWWLGQAYDIIFENSLLNKYPREPQILREFRKSVYRPFQTAPLLEAIQSLSASIFGSGKYIIHVDDEEDNKYINEPNFEGKTFVGYFEWMFKSICEDPNSLFVVLPKQSRRETTGKVEPYIKHIPSTCILYIGEDGLIFYEPYSNDAYAWYINETGYFRFKKENEEWINVDGENDGYYAHMIYNRPVHFAGGIWNTMRYYDSYLKGAQAYCDEFVSAYSDVQLVNKEACFPFIQAIETDCPTCNGIKTVPICNTCKSSTDVCSCSEEASQWGRGTCNDCNGTGIIQSFNPGQWYQVPKNLADKDLIKIINFDVNVNKHLAETAENLKEGIRKALHQVYVDQSQSGVAKEIDREPAYLFRSFVAKGVFCLMEECMRDILSLRHMDMNTMSPNIPNYEVIAPADFALKTEIELLEEYKEGGLSQLPDWVRQTQLTQFVDKVYAGNDVMKKKVRVINSLDPYSVTSTMNKSAMLSSGTITIDDFVWSTNLPAMVDEVIKQKSPKWFLTATDAEVKSAIMPIFAALPKPEKPQDETLVKENVNN